MLRDEHCQLLITPRPPDASDIVQERLFEDRYLVYYDAAVRAAPRSLADYLCRRAPDGALRAAPHGSTSTSGSPNAGTAAASPPPCRASPASAAFLRGSRFLATLPGLLRANLLRGFAVAEPPFACPPMPMYTVWHLRHQADPCTSGCAASCSASWHRRWRRPSCLRPKPRRGVAAHERHRGPARAAAAARRALARRGGVNGLDMHVLEAGAAGRPACCCCTAFPSWPTAGAR